MNRFASAWAWVLWDDGGVSAFRGLRFRGVGLDVGVNLGVYGSEGFGFRALSSFTT